MTYIIVAISASGQQVRFLDEQFNLPGSLIDRIFQDPHGNVWLVGQSGVIKCNGISYNRVPLRYENAPTLPWVRSMAFLDGERIVFGTSRGIVVNECLRDTFYLLPVPMRGQINNYCFVSSIVECKALNALIVTCSGDGIATFDSRTLAPLHELSDTLNNLVKTIYPGVLFIDSRQCLWAFSSEGNFFSIDLNTFTLNKIDISPELVGMVVTRVAEVPGSGDMLLATSHHGILRYDRKTGKVSKTNAGLDATGRIFSIICTSDYGSSRRFWVGSEDFGLLLYNDETQTVERPEVYSNRIDLRNCKIHDIFEDRQGNIWASAYQKGVVLIPKSSVQYAAQNLPSKPVNAINNCPSFRNISLTDNPDAGIAPVTSIIGGDGGSIWAGTDGGGVFKILPDGSRLRFHTGNCNLPNNSITAIAADQMQNLWVATYNGGLSKMSPSGKAETVFTAPQFQKIHAMEFDSVDSRLYLGTLGNGTYVVQFDGTNIDTVFNITYPLWVNGIFIDSRRNLVINNTFVNDSQPDTLRCISRMGEQSFCAVAEDSEHNYYLGGEEWIVKYCPDKDQLETLPSTVYKGTVRGMTIDRYGNLWYTIEDRLVHYSISENVYESFTMLDGLPSNEFCLNAVHQDSAGRIYLGTNNGLTVFNPHKNTARYDLKSELYFSALWVAGEWIDYDEKGKTILDAPLGFASNITLKYRQNNFTLQFGINEYVNQHRIRFKYRLRDFDDTWYNVQRFNRIVAFTNVPEGEYDLELVAYFENNPDQQVCRSIHVKVLPPWYNTWIAYLAYIVVAVLGVLLVKRIIDSRLTLRRQQELNQKNEMRLQMFTNLSHEIRTPLSLVETPLNSLLEQETDAKKSAVLQLMKRNVQRVSSQLNRIMDIRKIDNNKFVLKLKNTGIVDFVSDIVKSFDQLSLARNINVNLSADNPDLVFAFDPFNIDKVVFNILSNAFKFTPDGGVINISVETSDGAQPQYVAVKIENSGSHIPDGELDKVFDRYYQTSNNSLNEGSGIGLHLAKMIVEAHKGSICAMNTEQGVAFEFTLPYFKMEDADVNDCNPPQNIFAPHFVEVPAAPATDAVVDKKLKKILFIDDDTDWTSYISIALSDTFNTIVCNKPEAAVNMIIQCEPEAVVTDLMMPGVSGIDICKKIRQMPQTSLLPVIVLTSTNDEESRRLCVETGADHYLTKPVSLNMLRSSIANAIKIRQQMKLRITADVQAGKNIIDAKSPDAVLLRKVTDAILENLGNGSFGVNELSAHIGISRVHLNRKLKELLNITTVNLIKTIKMKQAAKLLVERRLNVADVAYKLGFSSHSYFSSHFREYFGISPTEFVAKYSTAENYADFERLVQ